jgi:hypothetical protein
MTKSVTKERLRSTRGSDGMSGSRVVLSVWWISHMSAMAIAKLLG